MKDESMSDVYGMKITARELSEDERTKTSTYGSEMQFQVSKVGRHSQKHMQTCFCSSG